ncbi:ATP-binding protein [Novilysobacter arseniciresistens]|uniref:ATP-binding protein n=1 Tax=Novilysobacter arseniciresistens TaxID=1385522 RepID=UPI0009E0117C|nr:ATP-binding protein [Lysobacter arseniciresistens]
MAAIAVVDRARTAISLGESHFREFKSALHGAPGQKTLRTLREISIDISQTLVGFANADGGELLVGVEDSGEITGVDKCSPADLEVLQAAPVTHVHRDTPLPEVRRSLLDLDGRKVLYFSVPKSTRYIHVTSDGRCLQRRDLETVPVAAEAIQFDRQEQKSREYDREFVDGVSADDLNLDLVRAVADQVMRGMSVEKCLQYLGLAEYGLSHLRIRRGALLLFAKDAVRWHPRIQVRILKVDGDTLKTGEAYNVGPDQVVSDNILTLIDKSWEALRPHLVQTKFDKAARFEQRSIYPELACREALLNAIAHRDYSDEGRGVEIYIFDSHLEFVNPGALLSSIRVDDLQAGKGTHQSRNTNIARVLRELGYMRELGEGMRRIYELMNVNELAPPNISSSSSGFKIVLTHRPLYSERDQLWLSQFDQMDLDREQKAVILLGRDGRVFSVQQIWDAVGIVDTEHYRKLVDGLMRGGALIKTIGTDAAKKAARKKKIPFREFPRYAITVPSAKKEHSRVEAVPARNPTQELTNADDVRKQSCRVFVANLPEAMTREELFDSFSFIGEIAEIRFSVIAGRSKGYAIIEFGDETAAAKAIGANGLEFEGRKLVIRPDLPREQRPRAK